MGGTAVSATTVEVLVMPYKAIAVHHPLATVDSASVIGHGSATVVSQGRGVRGSWYRPSARTLCNVVDGSNQSVHPRPGSAWILLAPTGSTVTMR